MAGPGEAVISRRAVLDSRDGTVGSRLDSVGGVSGLSLDGTASGSGEEQADQILAIVREVLAEPGITADDELTDHGGTSLSIVRIVALASRTLNLDINPRELDGTVTARGLAKVARGPSLDAFWRQHEPSDPAAGPG